VGLALGRGGPHVEPGHRCLPHVALAGVPVLAWIDVTGNEMRMQRWADHTMCCFGMMLDGRAPSMGLHQKAAMRRWLIVFNPHHEVVVFTLPGCAAPAARPDRWCLTPAVSRQLPARLSRLGDVYDMPAHSLLLFVLRSLARGEIGGLLARHQPGEHTEYLRDMRCRR
jgi:hypothetical protein